MKAKIQAVSFYIACISSSIMAVASGGGDDERPSGIPSGFTCSITQDIMVDPVSTDDGQTYERTAILAHFAERRRQNLHLTSPLAGDKVLASDVLRPNYALRSSINDWNVRATITPIVVVPGVPAQDPLELARFACAEFADHIHLLHSSTGKNIVAFLGNTGAGKSTLINDLASISLRKDGRNFVLSNPGDPRALPIGVGADSKTLYPKYVEIDDLILFDLPGFNDTDGTPRNLVNAAFIKHILINAESVRVVVVVGEDQLADRAESVRRVLPALHNLFVTTRPETDLLREHSILVMTKSGCDNVVDDADHFLKSTISTNGLLHRQLATWLSGSPQDYRFGHMRTPSMRNADDPTDRLHILKLVSNISGGSVEGIRIGSIYPTDMNQSLVRMFYEVIGQTWNTHLQIQRNFNTLALIDGAIVRHGNPNRNEFWDPLLNSVLDADLAYRLLKEFCENNWERASQDFKQAKEGERVQCAHYFLEKRKKRVRYLEDESEKMSQQVVRDFRENQGLHDPMTFDFAFQRDMYERMCGDTTIGLIAQDDLEKGVVKKYCAGFMSRHSQQQLDHWYQSQVMPRLIDDELYSRRNIEQDASSNAQLLKELLMMTNRQKIALDARVRLDKQESTRAIDALRAEVRQTQTQIATINVQQTKIAAIFNHHTHQSPNADGCMCRTTQHPNQTI